MQTLLIVAHPDDETIFFGGLILSKPHWNWKIICVTDGDSDGRGALRKVQFEKACKKLGVKNFERWDFPDVYEKRINLFELNQKLSILEKPKQVFTHGILGEYGHPHHQDVSFATHQVFCQKKCAVYSPAHNSFGSLSIKLNPRQFKTKTEILSRIYFDETKRFISLIPAQQFETFVKVGLNEVEEIYRLIRDKKEIDTSKLKVFRWMAPYLKSDDLTQISRLF